MADKAYRVKVLTDGKLTEILPPITADSEAQAIKYAKEWYELNRELDPEKHKYTYQVK